MRVVIEGVSLPGRSCAAVIAAARRAGARLVGRLGLTGGDGGPRCAAVHPPGIEWSAE